MRSGAQRLQAIVNSDSPQEQLDGVLNTGAQFARTRAEKQLVFHRDRGEAQQVEEGRGACGHDLMRDGLPEIPKRAE